MYRIKNFYMEEDKGPLMMSLPSVVVHNRDAYICVLHFLSIFILNV